jgi:sugar phosphate isomerase/epimerase
MLLGYNTNGFAHHRLEDALAILADLGYRSVALTLDYHALDPFAPDLPRQLTAVQDLHGRRGLRSVVETGARFLLDPRHKHQPTLLGPDPAQRDRRLDFLRRAVDVAGALGADAVSFWSGSARDPEPDAALMDRLVEGCRQLCAHAALRGVRLAFEPEPGMFIDTMARFAELHERVGHPLFGLTIDVGHLHCLGEVPIADHLRRWHERLWNVHIEDMRRGVHEHLMFGAGEIDFGAVLGALAEVGYEGGVHVELSRHSHDAVETARRALTFLQSKSSSILPVSLPLPEAQPAAPHADQVARAQRRGAVDALAVKEGAAGGAGVVEQVAAAPPQDAGVCPLDGGVAEQADVTGLGPADGHRRAGQDQFPPGPEA